MKVFVKKGEVVNGIGGDEWCLCGHQQAVHDNEYGCQIHNFDPDDKCDCSKFIAQHPSLTRSKK